MANPIKLSATPVRYRKAPPTQGEDTAAVLARALGLDAAQLATLRAQKVI